MGEENKSTLRDTELYFDMEKVELPIPEATIDDAVQATEQCIEVMVRFTESEIQILVDKMVVFRESMYEIFPNLENGRILQLARFSKKKRVRNKNINRIFGGRNNEW